MRSTSKRIPPDLSPSYHRWTLRRWLDRLAGGGETTETKRGRLLLETLEPRQLLAGDVELLFTDGVETVDDTQSSQTATGLRTTSEAEGELAPDLVAFAEALTEAGVQFFGAAWCPACTLQKELFQDGGDELPFIEVTGPDRSLNDIGIAEGIEEFPTWEFPDGTRLTGFLDLQTLSDRSEVAIPQSETPIFETIGNQTVQIGSPLHIPVDAYDPDGGEQTVTVTVENPELLQATLITGNRSIRIDMATYGDMVFELFEQRAETAAGRVIALAQADPPFYDGIIFHRIVDQFVIQAGDPTGTGTSGSSLGTFPDDFHPDLQHNRTGVLSFAKAGDDTNNSQFFITEVPTRFLDFNHSVFGQLVEGDDVREAISNHQTNSSGLPSQTIAIETIDVFNDVENSVVMLKAAGNATGSTNVTFTVTDPDGNSFSETVQVDVVPDGPGGNSQPFLNAVSVPSSSPLNLPVEVQLSSTDVEGDAVEYFASIRSGNATVSADPITGLLTVTPAIGFAGEVQVQAGVRPGPGVVGNSATDQDTELLRFNFEGEQLDPPSSIDLLTGSDSGSSNIDNITNLESLSFSVSGVADGATVEITLVSTGAVLGTGTASGTTATITTNNIAALGDGSFEIAARQRVGSDTSSDSASITIVYDSVSPVSVIDSAAKRGNVGIEYRTDLINAEEGSGLRYALVDGPDNASIDAATGLITWTPTASQVGTNSFNIELTDVAGNALTETFDVVIAEEPLAAIKLEVTDLDGNGISNVQVGQEFFLNFIGVDTRNAFDRLGIFAAFADVFFDPTLVRAVPAGIEFDNEFPALNSGTILPGQIDELGAATDRLSATNLAESPIAKVRFEAIAAGSVNFLSDPAEADISEVLLYGNDNRIEADSVEYRSVSLAIGQNFIITNDTFTVAEDSGATTLAVLDNDDVVQGTGTLSVVSVTQPANGGTVTLSAGEVVFTPAANFNGQATFTYQAGDGTGAQDAGTVTVTVTAVNDPPTGVADTFEVDENSSGNSLDVLANDSDRDAGDSLSIQSVRSDTSGASVQVSSTGQSIIYAPPADFTGTDTFTYTLSDRDGLTTEVGVTVTVKTADPPPTAVDDSFDIDEDDTEAEFDILSNDTRDAADQPFVLDSVTANQGGTARISADGTQFFYTPAADFFGSEQVTYTIRDTGGGIASATATFRVAGSNDPPPTANPTVRLNRGVGESVIQSLSDLPANVDGDDETLSFTDSEGTTTAGGSFRITAGQIFYTPPSADFVGTDTVSFTVNDGTGLTSSGEITVEVVDLVPRDILVAAALESLPRINGIKLTGTNALGEPVEMDLLYGADGSEARFADVLPGEYSVQIPAIPFLQKAETAQVISVVSAPEDGDTTVTPEIGRLRPEFISIRDWLGSAPRHSILAAVAPGSRSILTNPSPSAAAETITEPVVDLDETGGMVTVGGTTPGGGDIDPPVELSTALNSEVQIRGTRGDLRLYKISAGPSIFPASGTGAEGELIRSVTSDLTVSGGAEGELVAATSQINTTSPALASSSQNGDPSSPLLLADTPTSSASVDAAMQDVAEQLTLISPTAEALAEAGGEASGLDDLAVDAALSGQL